MRLNSSDIKYIVGNEDVIRQMSSRPVFRVFDDVVVEYLDKVSKILLSNNEAKKFPDVVTFAFWCRKANIKALKKTYTDNMNQIGRGVVFHIAPSNVPVNFAYSLVVGMLAGNANIVRVPSKEFEQVKLICDAFTEAQSENMKNYISCIQYEHNKEITDSLSDLCDTRIIWGGDQTIETIRKSRLKPRATEITFADRYSICVIEADRYLEAENKKSIALGFYNDTYLTDQNACTSPRLVVWMGNNIEKAQNTFWSILHDMVEEKYTMQPVQAISKYSNLLKQATNHQVHVNKEKDNYIIRVKVNELSDKLMEYKGNSGYFMEYVAKSFDELLPLCSQQCQTISYFGIDKNEIGHSMITLGARGVDRIVPIGNTMDFSLTWDGHDLINGLSRQIVIY